MKKLIFLLAFVFVGAFIYAQDSVTVNSPVTDLVVVGSGGHSLGGDSKKEAYTKINAVFAVVDSVYSVTIPGTVTDGTPSAAEIAAALDMTPSGATGKMYKIVDSSGTKLVYLIFSDGTAWYFLATTKAS